MKKLYEKNELTVFRTLPIKHKCITAQPLIERANLEPYLDGVELVVVGGESDRDARPLDYDWVLDIREQCIRKQVNFEFRQCGTHFIKAGNNNALRWKLLGATNYQELYLSSFCSNCDFF